MSHDFADIDVLFIAGFGPITRSTSQSRDFYCQALGLPLKPMPVTRRISSASRMLSAG